MATETRTVSMGQAVSIAIGIIVSVFIWGKSVDSKLSVLDTQVQENSRRIEINDQKQDNNYSKLIMELKEVNKNLVDLKVELQNKANR